MTEFEYYRFRLSQEDERASRTMGSEAELVHRALAAQYARKAMAALSAAADNDGTMASAAADNDGEMALPQSA